MPKRKYSPSALTTFLESPRRYHYRYILGLEPLVLTQQGYGHDLRWGTVWASFVERFYNRVPEKENRAATADEWLAAIDQIQWLPSGEKVQLQYSEALLKLVDLYYSRYSPDDGVRLKSELYLENDFLYGTLDGLGEGNIIHECKGTKRAKSLDAQHKKYLFSIQTKCYAVLTQAKGIRIELAFKDAPYDILRYDTVDVTAEMLAQWERELRDLCSGIDQMESFPCHPQGCAIVSPRFVSECEWQPLCDGQISESDIPLFYKRRTNNR